jgi:hypothetical protein
VSGLWRSLTGKRNEPYRLERVVDTRWLETESRPARHIVCDIDKTYLETEFESVVRMARIAFEGASDKITVSGATDVLLAARWGDVTAAAADGGELYPRPLHFVSSSPPQLRAVLEEKLAIDQLDWTSDSFKNQAYNLRMGRVDLLRRHVAYKSSAILGVLAKASPGSLAYMLGDNAEMDAAIYLGVALYAARRFSADEYRDYLIAAGAEPASADEVIAACPEPPPATVQAILIRRLPGYPVVLEPGLTGGVIFFDNYLEAAAVLMHLGLIAPECAAGLARSFHNLYGMSRAQVAGVLATLAAHPGVDATLRAEAEAMRELLRAGVAAGARADAPALAAALAVASPLPELDGAEALRRARLWFARGKAARDA